MCFKHVFDILDKTVLTKYVHYGIMIKITIESWLSMSKVFWCFLIFAVLLLVSCDSSVDTSTDVSQNQSVATSETSYMSGESEATNGSSADVESEVSEPVQSSEDITVESDALSDEPSSESMPVSSEEEESSAVTSEEESDESEEVSIEDSSDEVESSSEQPSESSEEESSEETSSEPTEKPSAPISSVNRNDVAVNLAKGNSYTIDKKAHSQYPDTGNKLTDGVHHSTFDNSHWIGINPPATTVIVLDLGKVEKNIADFAVGILRQTDYGIGSPEMIEYEISTDGKNYKKIGTVYRAADVGSVSSFDYNLNLAEPVSARYVRYTIKGTNSSWLFIGELYAVRYESEEERASYYDEVKLPQISTPAYWPQNSADRDKTINLIAGKKPGVVSEDVILNEFATEYYNSIQALPQLTDGKFANKATYSDGALVHFTRGGERYIYFNLGYTSAVSGVTYSFLNELSTGVFVPSVFSVSLSENGTDWQCVYQSKPSSNKENELFKQTITFDKVYKARFVKITFAVSSHAFCDELQIWGTKAIPSNAVSIVPDKDQGPNKLGYIMPEDFLGVHNIFLSYHCNPDGGKHSENGLITMEEYLPHVGYYDQSGKLVDTFYDGFLYLPYTSFNFSDYACSLDGWKFYLDDIYTEDRNMDALNQAVEKVKTELNKPNYKCTVFTSILYPWTKLYVSKTPNTFGDLNGDGVNESFASLENRKKAVKWMMDQEYNRFKAGNYDNLEFGGFYWFEEAISVGSADDKELINYAADYAHSLGVKIFWIPYYCASGYDRWQEYGFDLVCMQPNYMFGNSSDPSVLQSTAEKAIDLGMCVEIEMNSLSREEVLRYLEYLSAGEKYGYMNAVKIYYQGGVPGVVYSAYKSKDPFERAVYDLTYMFAKEKFTAKIPDFNTPKLNYVCSGNTLKGDPIVEADGSFRLLLNVSPSHGDLRLNENGSFIYYPNKDFVGVDKFSVVLDYGYGRSEEIVLTITVE